MIPMVLESSARKWLIWVDVIAVGSVALTLLAFVILSAYMLSNRASSLTNLTIVVALLAWIPVAAHVAQSHVTPRWISVNQEGLGWSSRNDHPSVKLRWSQVSMIARRNPVPSGTKWRVWLEFQFTPKAGFARKRYLSVSDEVAVRVLNAWREISRATK